MERSLHAGWRSRGYIPHFDASGLVQHVVFGLADSEERFDLRDSALASIVEDVMLHADGERYRLLAWCIMPSHVHVVFEQLNGTRLDAVLHAWKSASAHRINRVMGRTGSVWTREYFDRFMRSDYHFLATVRYVENNPVDAKLVSRAADWRFSSAWRRENAAG